MAEDSRTCAEAPAHNLSHSHGSPANLELAQMSRRSSVR